MDTKIETGQVWRGIIFDDVLIQIDSVNEKTNTLKAHVSGGKSLSYRLDTFAEYYKLDEEIVPTRVIFKYDMVAYPHAEKNVTAYLLDLPDGNYITCYAHIGQHSNADKGYIRSCQLAERRHYNALAEELESIGYFLNVVKRMRSTD